MINKEYGSDFHLSLYGDFFESENNKFLNKENYSLYFSGRSALVALLKYGIKSFGWHRVYFPNYYCHEVVHFVRSFLPIEIAYYNFNPFIDSTFDRFPIYDDAKNVIINVCFFGLKKLDLLDYSRAAVIEDLTHDILSIPTSNFSFGSLRKQLPLPCGGFIYSRKKERFSNISSNLQSENLSLQKLTGMFLKNEYLYNRLENKSIFRKLLTEAEEKFDQDFTNSLMPGVARVILSKLDINKILLAKNKNLKLALNLLKKNAEIIINFHSNSSNAFGLILEMKSLEIRDKLKSFLISRSIFPAILWPNQIESKAIETQQRILFVHVDYRYKDEDIQYIAATINDFFD
jgi:hypothetical protein